MITGFGGKIEQGPSCWELAGRSFNIKPSPVIVSIALLCSLVRLLRVILLALTSISHLFGRRYF